MKDGRILHAIVIVLVLMTICVWIGAWDANRRYRACPRVRGGEWQDYDLVGAAAATRVGTVITRTLGVGPYVRGGNYDGITVDYPAFTIERSALPTSFAITVTYTITEFEAIFGPGRGNEKREK